MSASDHIHAPELAQMTLSPDGTLRLELLISEWSPTFWTHAPRLTDIASGRLLFDLWGTSWDAQAAWVGANGLRLDLRRYDLAGAFTLLLDLQAESYAIPEVDPRYRPLGEVRRGMDEAFERAHSLFQASVKAIPDGAAPLAATDSRAEPHLGNNPRKATLIGSLFRALTGKRAGLSSK